MNDDGSGALRDTLAALALGVAAVAGWLWRYMRPGASSGTVTVTPADVRERVNANQEEMLAKLALLSTELTKLQFEMELFIQEERQIHPQIVAMLQDALREIKDASAKVTALQLTDARRP